jgi:undecaprenyl diphosphate synthase
VIAQTPASGAEPGLARHVAMIMDGNRRWARERGLTSIDGHRAGARTLREITRASTPLGIEILTVYAFSEENWQREPSEVDLLMELVRAFAHDEREALGSTNVRVQAIGRLDALPVPTKLALDALIAATAGNDGLILNLALNYGSRSELCDAIRALSIDVKSGRLALSAIDDNVLSTYLYTAGLPDPDLLIRTGGELRLSNFLLYQVAYTELWSTPVYWPDFDADRLAEALASFATRQRRFGR